MGISGILGGRGLLGDAASDRLKFRVLAASLIVSLFFLALLTKSILDVRSNIYGSTEKDLRVHSQMVLLNVVESLHLVDYTIKRARQEWLEKGHLRPHNEFVSDFPNYKDLIVQVAVIDEHGYLAASSLNANPNKVYLGDRAHFQIHVATQVDKVFISRPIVGRVSGQTTLQFTRPILGPNGAFLGVMVVSLNPEYLAQKNFEILATLGIKGFLLGKDGFLRVNLPSPTANLNPFKLVRFSPVLDGGGALTTSPLAGNYIWQQTSLDEYQLMLAVGYPQEKISERIQYVYWSAFVGVFVIISAIVWYTASILRLVTGRNNILVKLEESNVKANSANEMKSKFVSSISHELRTPLNGILGFSELVEMSGSLDEARKYGSIIHTSAEHLHQLVNTLLDLAKIEAGQMAVVRTKSNISELLDSVVSLHRFEAERKGLLLSLSFDQDLPKVIETDRIKLMQVLNNLISNAIKFTDSGAVFVSVKHSEHRWKITVADTGVGMSQAQIDGVFDRFNNVKLDSINTSEKQGAGLGMALCKELVELMNGQITLQSEVNVGTSVQITLQELSNENPN